MKKLVCLILSIVLFMSISSELAQAKVNQSEKWNSQKSLSGKDKDKLFSRYLVEGGSAAHYGHKNLYSGQHQALKPKNQIFFEPTAYQYKTINELNYIVTYTSSKKITLKKVKITVGKKSKTVKISSQYRYGKVITANIEKNKSFQTFLQTNIRMSKKATISYYTSSGSTKKTLTKGQKEAILDNITLYAKYLN